jgi:hypothetical protein
MSVPSAEDWRRAVDWTEAQYPPAVFPPDSDSLDARSGTFARHVCRNIRKEARRIMDARTDGELAEARGDVALALEVRVKEVLMDGSFGGYCTEAAFDRMAVDIIEFFCGEGQGMLDQAYPPIIPPEDASEVLQYDGLDGVGKLEP